MHHANHVFTVCTCKYLSHRRAQAYSNNLVDHHLILDLLPGLAAAFFAGHLPASMSLAQAAILLAMVTARPAPLLIFGTPPCP